MPKELRFSEEARQSILDGVATLEKAVRATMGPKGRNVVISRKYGSPLVTKDGVTVAKEIELEDPFENMGAQLVKEAATKTNDACGDGTTTATVLAHAMMKEGMRHLSSGANPILIKKGMEKAQETVASFLETIKRDVSKKAEYAAVATISAQDKEIGEVVAEVIDKVGKDGVITVEAGNAMDISADYAEGQQIDSGYASPYFADANQEAVMEDAPVLVTDRSVFDIRELVPLFEKLAQTGKKEIVVVAEKVGEEALGLMILNTMQGKFRAVVVRPPAFGERRKEIMKDLAITTGATFVASELGMKLEDATPEMLGRAKKVVVARDSTVIVGGAGDKAKVEARANEIRSQIDSTESEFDREKLLERLGKLTGKIGVIKVGALTEVEQKEKQHRVEDALSATRAAAEEGIVAGGGTAYIRALPELEKLLAATNDENEKIGIDIVIGALASPLSTIAENAGANGDEVVGAVMNSKGDGGYNALTGEYEDLVKAMVIDPKKVTRCALSNAVSVASMFVTLEVACVDTSKETPEA